MGGRRQNDIFTQQHVDVFSLVQSSAVAADRPYFLRMKYEDVVMYFLAQSLL